MTTGPEYDGTRIVPIDPKTYDVSAPQNECRKYFDIFYPKDDCLIHFLYSGTLSPTVFE